MFGPFRTQRASAWGSPARAGTAFFLLSSALAAATEPVRFEYRAPADCPDESAFLERVRERSVSQRLAEPGELARSFTVFVEVSAEGATARVDFVDADGALVSRTVRGATCDEVVSGIALVSALAIDARATAEPPVVPPAPPPVPAPAPAPPPPPERAPAPAAPAPVPKEPFAYTVGAGAGFASAAAPGGAFSADVFFALELARHGPVGRIGAWHLRRDAELDAGYAAHFRGYGGRLEGCPLVVRAEPFFVEPCLAADLGALLAEGVDSPTLSARESADPWFAVSAVGRAGLVLGGRFVIELQGELAVPFVKPEFGFGTPPAATLVFEVPPVGGSARAGFGIRFP